MMEIMESHPKEKEQKHQEAFAKEHKNSEYVHDVHTFLSWEGPGRPFKKKTKQYFLSALLITFLIELILFLFSQYELMLAVLAILFLATVLSYVPPRNFRYKISTEGVTVEDHYFLWQELYDFYFKKVENTEVLHIRTQDLIPGELKIPLEGVSRDHVRRTIVQFLPYREIVRQTFMEKAGDWLARNFPLENPA